MQVSWSPIASCSSAAATAEIDAARQAADHAAARRPGRGSARSPRRGTPPSSSRREQPQTRCVKLRSSRPPCGVCTTSGWNSDAVEPALVVGDRGIGRALARRHRAKAGRQRIDLVAVAHPHLLARARRPQPLEQAALAGDVDKGAAEFLMVAERDPAAELGAHRLHAVADRRAPARRAGTRCRARAASSARVTEAGPPDRMMPRGREVADAVGARRVGPDLAIDAVLAHAAGDQLRDLAAEIEDQDAVGHFGASERSVNAKATSARREVIEGSRCIRRPLRIPRVLCVRGFRCYGCALEDRDEEPVGAMPRRGQAEIVVAAPASSPPIVSAQARAAGYSAKSAWAARNASACASFSSRSSEQVA